MRKPLTLLFCLSLAACGSNMSSNHGDGGGNHPGADGGGNHPGGDGGGNNPGVDGGGGGGGSGEIFPSDNPWNTDITNAPVDPKSAQYIANIGTNVGLHADFDSVGDGIPYVEVPANQPLVPVSFDVADESDPGPYPIPDNAPIEGGSDAHVLVVDLGNGFLYEMGQAMKQGNGWHGYSGAKFNLRSNALRPAGWTSADAAGLPIFPGLVRYDEVMSGSIKHALRFTVPTSQKGYVLPGTHAAGSQPMGSAYPPMALRLRLKASVDISGYPAEVQVVLTALKHYGMFVADNGSAWYISGAPDNRWNDDNFHKMSGIKGSDFEVIQSGTIMPQ